ncbi:hypothetical protein GCM10010182_67230 [Actinomadura cremea]|nr:hypothetical protein GCM10010182_67230 [Actinomadura cremea]
MNTPTTRTITGREMTGVLAEIARHGVAAAAAAYREPTGELLARRDELAAHIDHRVEVRDGDGTVVGRGVLTSATAGGLHLTHVEAGSAFTPLGGVAAIVRLAALACDGFAPGDRVRVGGEAGTVLFTSPGRVTVGLNDGSRRTVPTSTVRRDHVERDGGAR